ncbi:MAG TPA: transglycosylase domain-containing protein, partial [Hyphomicrobium sp.]|nr:transglycosylase domain-containing protein [Hyphomicrobium sp.]
VVKNLFLWPSKSYIRKAIELPLTYLTELVWPKRRIMEIYLNIAQWGPDIFGIGAAAEYHFHKTARSLSVRDAARLAVSLPNPLERNAGRPGPGLQRLANAIQVRMRLAPSSQLSCVLPRRLY